MYNNRRYGAGRRKVVMTLTAVLCAMIVAVVGGVVAILANQTQRISSSISITYIATDVDGEMRLRAYYKDSNQAAKWHNLTDGTSDGFVMMNKDVATPVASDLDAVTLDKFNDYIVFECAFRNLGGHIVKVNFLETDTQEDSNMIKTKKISKTALNASSFDTITDGFNSYSSLAVAGIDDVNYINDYVYYYVKVRIANKGFSAGYQTVHNWTFTGNDNVTTLTLDNSSWSGPNRQIDAIEGALLPIQSIAVKANSVTSGMTTEHLGGLLYVDGSGIPLRELDSTELTSAKLYQDYTDVIDVTNNVITYTGTPAQRSMLRSVEIPTGVTAIPDDMFKDCVNLTEITLPSTIETIGDSAFENCSSLKEITIPSATESIGDSAFKGCSSMNYAIFKSDSVLTTIGEEAFKNCVSLTSLSLPSGVTSISNGLVEGCEKLVNFTANGDITTIGARAFKDCVLLSNPYGSSAEYVSTIGSSAYENCASMTSFTVPQSVTTLNDRIFAGCSNLMYIYLDENSNLTTLGSAVFSGCDSLTDAAIGENLTTVSAHALDGMTTIPSLMFRYAQMTSITIPNTVTSIGFDAFQYCSNLTSVTFENGISLENIPLTAFEYCTSLTSITIPNGVKRIHNGAFDGCTSLTSITIPNGVTNIGPEAFKNCTSLASITIPGSVRSIGFYAFYNCNLLTNLTISNGVQSIGEYAFMNCSGLTSIVVPNSVTSIGYKAFMGCSGLVSMSLPFVGARATGSENNNQYPFGYIFGMDEYVGATQIRQPHYATYPNTQDDYYYIPNSLRTVTITGGTQIPCGAFYYCSNLTTINITGTNITSIGKWAFVDCGATTVTLPNSLQTIGMGAFSGAGLTSITLPASTRYLDYDVFYECDDLASVTLNDGLLSIGAYAFCRCTSLTSLVIPTSVTTIGKEALNGCSAITTLTIPRIFGGSDASEPAHIGYVFGSRSYNNSYYYRYDYQDPVEEWRVLSGSYYVPTALTTVNFTGETLPDSAFDGCTSLTTINFTDNLTEIGERAFDRCTSLTTLYIPNSVETVAYYIGEAVEYLIDNNGTYYEYDNAYYLGNSTNNYLILAKIKDQTQTSVTINSNTKFIDVTTRTFNAWSSLEYVTIPASVVMINGYFMDCYNLTSVTFENTQNWYHTDTHYITDDPNWAQIDLTNPSSNASLFNNYNQGWFKRSSTPLS